MNRITLKTLGLYAFLALTLSCLLPSNGSAQRGTTPGFGRGVGISTNNYLVQISTTPDPDGVTTDFFTMSAFEASTLKVYRGSAGGAETLQSGVTVLTSNSFRLSVVPKTGEVITVDYIQVGSNDPTQFELNVITITDDFTTSDANDVIWADASNKDITVTLHAVADAKIKQYDIIKIDPSANTVTIDPNGSEEINDDLTAVLLSESGITIVHDTTEWRVK